MNIRPNSIYVSSEVHRWLRILSKAEPIPVDGEANQICTPDAIADQILRQAIREQHPKLAEHQKEIDKLEKQLIENLQNDRHANDKLLSVQNS